MEWLAAALVATAFVAIKYGGFIVVFCAILMCSRPRVTALVLAAIGVVVVILSLRQDMPYVAGFLICSAGMVTAMASVCGLIFVQAEKGWAR